MHFFSDNKDLLIILLVKLGIIASLAALLARSLKFKKTLYAEPRGFQEKLNLVLYWGVPLAIGVAIRNGLGYPAFDLTLEGTFIAGLLGGNVVGLIVGSLVGLTAMFHREWLALPLAAILGLASGLLRNLTPRKEEIWNFSPFVVMNIFQSLRSRVQSRKVVWQLVLLSSCLVAEAMFFLVDHSFPTNWLFRLESSDPVIILLIFVTTLSCVGITLKIWNNTRLEMKLAEQEVLVVKSRLDALANQINPHFLFNTLNSISSLIRTNPAKARTMVIKLSHILRKLLQGHENFISLREDLEFIDNYLDIEEIRFGKDKLRIEKEIDAETLGCLIPSMILQPIIENSIKHGIAPKIEGGRITIRATRHQDRISIEVEDNGVGMEEDEIPKVYNSGIGISNIIERLKVVYHSDYVFSVKSFPGHGTFTHIEIPIHEGTREKARLTDAAWALANLATGANNHGLEDFMPISCIIVDDEQPALEEINFLLESIPEVKVIGQGRNGIEAIQLVEELEPDLLFLDIEMPGLNGFKVVEQLASKDELPQVIFVTAYDQYAVQAFDVNAVDYILKPIEKSRLEKAVQRAMKQLESETGMRSQLKNLISLMAPAAQKKSKLLLKDKNRNLLVDSEEIVFASVSDSVVYLSTMDLSGETNFRTLEELQANLDPEIFWRVHRSFLVNLNKIKEVVPWFNRTLQLKMADKRETEIPVSRSHSRRLKEYLKL